MTPNDKDDHFPGRLIAVNDRGHDFGLDVGWGLEIEASPLVQQEYFTTSCEPYHPDPTPPPCDIPEPGSLILMLGGLLCLSFRWVNSYARNC